VQSCEIGPYLAYSQPNLDSGSDVVRTRLYTRDKSLLHLLHQLCFPGFVARALAPPAAVAMITGCRCSEAEHVTQARKVCLGH
jgi:hypothetical protein